MTSLPADAFSGLTALTYLDLTDNALGSLPAGVFSGVSNLGTLILVDNNLRSLPDEVFLGLTGLSILQLRGNDVDPLPLTVTVEKVGTDKAGAKVAAGAPFTVEFTPTVANGSLPGSDPKLAVAAGSVNGTEQIVTRTSGRRRR